MQTLAALSDATGAIDLLLIEHGASMPADAKAALLAAGSKVSPVDKIVGVAEALYANRADLGPDALNAAAQLVEFATRNGWHGLGNDGRGMGMYDALRRDLGEPHPTGGDWPSPEADPAPIGNTVAAAATPMMVPA